MRIETRWVCLAAVLGAASLWAQPDGEQPAVSEPVLNRHGVPLHDCCESHDSCCGRAGCCAGNEPGQACRSMDCPRLAEGHLSARFASMPLVQVGHLRAPDLSGIAITPAVRERLGRLVSASSLRLADTDASDVDAETLAALHDLRVLDLSRTRVTDAGAVVLARLPKLERIVLDGTRVTDEGLVLLARAKRLSFVSVKDTNVTEEGVERFRSARPDCEVER